MSQCLLNCAIVNRYGTSEYVYELIAEYRRKYANVARIYSFLCLFNNRYKLTDLYLIFTPCISKISKCRRYDIILEH